MPIFYFKGNCSEVVYNLGAVTFKTLIRYTTYTSQRWWGIEGGQMPECFLLDLGGRYG